MCGVHVMRCGSGCAGWHRARNRRRVLPHVDRFYRQTPVSRLIFHRFHHHHCQFIIIIIIVVAVK